MLSNLAVMAGPSFVLPAQCLPDLHRGSGREGKLLQDFLNRAGDNPLVATQCHHCGWPIRAMGTGDGANRCDQVRIQMNELIGRGLNPHQHQAAPFSCCRIHSTPSLTHSSCPNGRHLFPTFTYHLLVILPNLFLLVTVISGLIPHLPCK